MTCSLKRFVSTSKPNLHCFGNLNTHAIGDVCQVGSLEATLRSCNKVVDKDFAVLTELLMVQLLKLDTIEADGEAKVQRRIEVGENPFLYQTLYLSLSPVTNRFSNV